MKQWKCLYQPPGVSEAVPVTLTTNLDLAHEELPDRLHVPPVVGLLLESATSHPGAPHFRLSLEVVQVIHHKGRIEAELHLGRFWKGQSLRDFYAVYEKATGRTFI